MAKDSKQYFSKLSKQWNTLWGLASLSLRPTSIHKLALDDEKQKDIILALHLWPSPNKMVLWCLIQSPRILLRSYPMDR